MIKLSQVTATLRRKNRKNYVLLTLCCFLSVLLITAYVLMMRSPTVLEVLPEGGDSRKQVMMIFGLAVVGCAVFTTYASGLFLRNKSRETGILLALGASKKQVSAQLLQELALLSVSSCAAGMLCGTPFAWSLWQIFRKFVVDTKEMALSFDPKAYFIAAAFSVFVIVTLCIMGIRFLKRTNIIDVVNEQRKSEPIHAVPRWYGAAGIVLMAFGGFLGYIMPTIFVKVFHWFAPEGLSVIFYLPLFIGHYMVLLHTVVNGWRAGRNHYRHIITTSMMKFQGRQTVRNMLVITVLIAGAYFASFYTPMLGTGAMMGFENRPVDYAFHYRLDQDMLTKEDIMVMAEEEEADITAWSEVNFATFGQDGQQYIEDGRSFHYEYRELLNSASYMSESGYNYMTGQRTDVAPGKFCAVLMSDGSGQRGTPTDQTKLYNMVTNMSLPVEFQGYLHYDMFAGKIYVLDDGDYALLAEGLTDEWMEKYVFFNVKNVEDTYPFGTRLLNEIIACSGPECEVYDSYDPVRKMVAAQAGEPYTFDREYMEENGITPIRYDESGSSEFRMYWKYMPQFRIVDQMDFVKTTAVFLMLFIFIAVVCFAAVIVIAYTRSITIALLNKQVYEDLRRLGASNAYLFRSVQSQISKVFFTPALIGTVLIYAFYFMIMFFNDNRLTSSELAGMAACALLIAACSSFLYLIYRVTRKKVCHMLNIR